MVRAAPMAGDWCWLTEDGWDPEPYILTGRLDGVIPKWGLAPPGIGHDAWMDQHADWDSELAILTWYRPMHRTWA